MGTGLPIPHGVDNSKKVSCARKRHSSGLESVGTSILDCPAYKAACNKFCTNPFVWHTIYARNRQQWSYLSRWQYFLGARRWGRKIKVEQSYLPHGTASHFLQMALLQLMANHQPDSLSINTRVPYFMEHTEASLFSFWKYLFYLSPNFISINPTHSF